MIVEGDCLRHGGFGDGTVRAAEDHQRMNENEQRPLAERCPQCGCSLTPIAYGYPGVEMFEAAERGEILLGGCVVVDGRPTSRCTSCGTQGAEAAR